MAGTNRTRKKLNDFNLLSAELSYFRVAFENKSINAAARRLNQSAANISRMIQRLESNMSAQLFIRHKTGLKATEDGEKLFRAITSAQSEFLTSFSHNEQSYLKVKIGFSSMIAFSYFNKNLVRGIEKENLNPEFVIEPTPVLIDKLKTRELDFIIISSSIKFPGVITKAITTENLVLCSVNGLVQPTLILHPDMVFTENVVHSIAYQNRWMIKDYFVVAKMLSENESLMGVLPQSLVESNFRSLKVIQTFEKAGKITAASWPGSAGINLLKYAKA